MYVPQKSAMYNVTHSVILTQGKLVKFYCNTIFLHKKYMLCIIYTTAPKPVAGCQDPECKAICVTEPKPSNQKSLATAPSDTCIKPAADSCKSDLNGGFYRYELNNLGTKHQIYEVIRLNNIVVHQFV